MAATADRDSFSRLHKIGEYGPHGKVLKLKNKHCEVKNAKSSFIPLTLYSLLCFISVFVIINELHPASTMPHSHSHCFHPSRFGVSSDEHSMLRLSYCLFYYFSSTRKGAYSVSSLVQLT